MNQQLEQNRKLTESFKGGVIMDVTNAKEAEIAQKAGAVAVMALERVPSDIRKQGGVARMSDPKMIKEIQSAVSIPVMAKARIGHIAEAQILEALHIDYIDESEVLTPADDMYHLNKFEFKTPFVCGAFTELFSKDKAVKALDEGKVVFFAGGTGHPYFSTDTATALRAIEIEADAILLAKSIDGVYDSDPAVNENAVKYDSITMEEVLDQKLGVIDLTATIMCLENKMPLAVFGLNEENSIENLMKGEFNGTYVTV